MQDCLDNQLTDDSEVAGLMHQLDSTPKKHLFFSDSGIHFCERLSKPQGLVQLEGEHKLKKCNYFIGSLSRNLPAYSIPPQPTMSLPHAPLFWYKYLEEIVTQFVTIICPEECVTDRVKVLKFSDDSVLFYWWMY
jgi:hypothetical protein